MCESAHYSGLIFMHDAGFFFILTFHMISSEGVQCLACACVTLRMQTSQPAVTVICLVTRLRGAYQIKDNLRLLNCLSWHFMTFSVVMWYKNRTFLENVICLSRSVWHSWRTFISSLADFKQRGLNSSELTFFCGKHKSWCIGAIFGECVCVRAFDLCLDVIVDRRQFRMIGLACSVATVKHHEGKWELHLPSAPCVSIVFCALVSSADLVVKETACGVKTTEWQSVWNWRHFSDFLIWHVDVFRGFFL